MGWWKYAKPGDKVVCVRQTTRSNFGEPTPLEVGKVYTIKNIRECVFSDTGVCFDIGFGGFPTPHFGARVFRPVQAKSTETGMSILRKIRDGSPVREYAQ